MKTALIALAAATVGLAVATPSFAKTKAAECLVVKNGRTLSTGDCDFERIGPNGSFKIGFPNGKAPLGRGVDYIEVKISRRGVGVAYASLTRGPDVRWGTVRRAADGACWVGSGLKICAR